MRPQVLGSGRRYRTSEVLNEDDLGVLWAGSDAWTGEAVTVRILRDRIAADPHRLQLVSDRLRRLQFAPPSSHLARLLDHDLRRLGGRQAFAVFAGSGEPLAVRLERSGPLETAQALAVVAAVADGLAAAHAARVVHGGLTPASVLVGQDGEVVVIDVGLGELLPDPQDRRRLATHGDPADRKAADVLAVTALFERLLGITPLAQMDADAPRPWERDVDPEVAPALRQASSPHRRLRPAMAELAAALAGVRSSPGLEAPAVAEPGATAASPVTEEEAAPAAPVPVAPAATERPAAPVAVRPAPPPVEAPAPPQRRRVALVVALVAVAVASVAAGMLALGGGAEETPTRSPATSPTPTASPSPTSTIVRATVPDALGLSVLEATELLESSGLVVGTSTPVPGALGVVVGTDPTPGEAVVAGTVVDLLVGDGTES
jgi:serine/threonine-protein kinase